MDPDYRAYFDKQLDHVLARAPEQVRRLLDEVPLYVEDYPSDKVMRQTGVYDRRQLCGLYTGIPLGSRSIEQSGILSDAIHIYREGISSLATDRFGQVDEEELQRQIRITVLHELGHHHGMTESELQALGY